MLLVLHNFPLPLILPNCNAVFGMLWTSL